MTFLWAPFYERRILSGAMDPGQRAMLIFSGFGRTRGLAWVSRRAFGLDRLRGESQCGQISMVRPASGGGFSLNRSS